MYELRYVTLSGSLRISEGILIAQVHPLRRSKLLSAWWNCKAEKRKCGGNGLGFSGSQREIRIPISSISVQARGERRTRSVD
jgi:hypothetical protein